MTPGVSDDGRRRRSEASRDAIVTALLALVEEGHVSPGADLVAARAGVSQRTVFRHFADMEALYAAMGDRLDAEYEGWQAPFAGPGWRTQLDEMVARRAATFERLMPMKRAADVHRHQSAELRRRQRALLARLRARLVALLPATIGHDPVRLEMLDLLLSFEAWQRLREEQALGPAAAERIVRAGVEAIVRKERG